MTKIYGLYNRLNNKLDFEIILTGEIYLLSNIVISYKIDNNIKLILHTRNIFIT